MSRVQAGETSAAEELCRRYQDRVFAAVRIRLGQGLRRKLESCDIVQEAMIGAIRGMDAFEHRSEGAFLGYVNQIVENRIRDAAKHWNAQRRDLEKEVALASGGMSAGPAEGRVVDPHVATPSKIACFNEDLARLEQAMDRLEEESTEQRELIIAVQLEGRTYRELAEQYEISSDAVRMRVNRALDRLESIFRELDER